MTSDFRSLSSDIYFSSYYMHAELNSQDCLSVIMPVYNEASTVEEVIRKVLRQHEVAEHIAVNDASRDETSEVLHRLAAEIPKVRAFDHSVNMGKGAALRTGIAHASRPMSSSDPFLSVERHIASSISGTRWETDFLLCSPIFLPI